jgi:hypothetical protein
MQSMCCASSIVDTSIVQPSGFTFSRRSMRSSSFGTENSSNGMWNEGLLSRLCLGGVVFLLVRRFFEAHHSTISKG